MKQDTKTKEDLIKSANLIREKYRALKRGKFIDEEQRLESLKPLTEPLQKLVKTKEGEESQLQQLVPYIPPTTPSFATKPVTPSRLLRSRQTPPATLNFGPMAAKYLGNYLKPGEKTDTTYGLRKDPNSKNFFIGNTEAEVTNNDITVAGKTYQGTEGLWSLLTLKEPDLDNVVQQEDLDNYKEILENTNAHKKGYEAGAHMSSNAGKKYTKVIRHLFAGKSGSGMKEVTGNDIDYVYWNDPNELVDRLRLLILSKEAGNTGVDNEIESIIQELVEEGIIN